MTHHSALRTVPYSSAQMFDLVADVARYPEFLPWCQKVHVIAREEDSFLADLTIGYAVFAPTFRSRVFLSKPYEIKVDYEGGALKRLKNHWKFRDLSQGRCEVDFLVDFSFGSGLLQATVETVFAKAVSQMIQAFEQRAKVLYALPDHVERV